MVGKVQGNHLDYKEIWYDQGQELFLRIVMNDSYSENREILKKTSFKICGLCGHRIKDRDLTVDHIVPLSRGGTNELNNLRLVHSSCNQIKGNLLDEELSWLARGYFLWLRFLSFFFS